MTLLLVMNLDFVWGAVAAPTGSSMLTMAGPKRQQNRRYRYNYGYRLIKAGVTWMMSLLRL